MRRNKTARPDRYRRAKARRGLAALEVLMSFGVPFAFAVVLFILAERSCGGLHHAISTMVGSPWY